MAKLTMKDLEIQTIELTTIVDGFADRITELEDMLSSSLTREGKLLDRVTELESLPKAKGRDYGPKSLKKLDDLTAWRMKFGDRVCFGEGKTTTVAKNADFFGLSRGQVYSLDKYTFQHVTEDSFTEDDIPVEIDMAEAETLIVTVTDEGMTVVEAEDE